MRLEVLVDQQEPLIFPLNKEKITIGSGESCDILLSAEGVSRKHAIIHCSEDEFYIIDQGSTNGTFINEERLVPGKRVEFTSFFPVRLGVNVLLTLLSDEEASDFALSNFNEKGNVPSSDVTSTRLIRPSELREVTNTGLNAHRKKASVRAKNAARSKTNSPQGKSTKKPLKKPERNLNIVIISSIVAVMLTIYYQISNKEEVHSLSVPQVATVGAIDTTPVEPTVPLVAQEFFKTPEEIGRIQMDFKCVTKLEKDLCETLNLTLPYGATQIGRDVFIFDKISFDKVQTARLKQIYPESGNGRFPVEAYTTLYFTEKSFQVGEEFLDYRIHLYFMNEEDEVLGGVSFYPKAYEAFKKIAPDSLFSSFLGTGKLMLNFIYEYFVFHNDFPPTSSPPEDEDAVINDVNQGENVSPVESESL